MENITPPLTPASALSPSSSHSSKPAPQNGNPTPHTAAHDSQPPEEHEKPTTHTHNPQLPPAAQHNEHVEANPAPMHVPLSQWLRPSLVLQNSGSTARDHLAGERTFLAYVRTSLALASMGVALVQLFTVADLSNASSPVPHLRQFARPLGTTTVLFGIMVLLIGFTRYFAVQTALTQGRFPTARSCILFITVVLTVIVAITFGVLLSGRAHQS